MSTGSLVLRSLTHYWRTHAGVVLGAAISTAILVGALAVGDSVRHTLRFVALARLGNVGVALDSGDRFFREQLAGEIAAGSSCPTAPVLSLAGIAANGDGSTRANGVHVLGVDPRFWVLGGVRDAPRLDKPGQVALNDRLATRLRVGVGDEVLLRFEKPGLLSRDVPLTPTDDATTAMRLTVAAVLSDGQFGRFSLSANQIAPYNAFVPLAPLQKKVGLAGRANLLLAGGNWPMLPPDDYNGPLYARWQPADAGIETRELPQQGLTELRTDRIFLDAPLAEAAAKSQPAPTGILTYFVNELRVGSRSAPYSMVTAIGDLGGKKGVPGFLPPDMADDEIVLNDWLAADLQAKPGDELEMAYYVIGPTRKLVEQRSRFRVRAVVPMRGLAADRDLMPNFPGLADVDNCRDWKPGIPIDLKKIRKSDEDYWKEHRGTPKAFLTLAAGQKLWANRFGSLTAIRYPSNLPRRLGVDPEVLGLAFRPVREEALRAASQALDFGQLFLGLSFFLIAAAVLLMGLLFVFGIEQRAGQTGLLLAVGFTPRRVRRLLLAEGVLLALVGGVAGTFAGTLYTRGVIHALGSVWSGAVASSAIQYHAEPSTLALGGGIGVAVAVLAMWLALRKQVRRPPRELFAGAGGAELVPKVGRRRIAPWIAVVTLLAGLGIVVAMGARRDQAAAMGFFGAGALLLVGGLAMSTGLLTASAAPDASPATHLGSLGWRNVARRRGRSLAVVALLACASFLVIAVGANRQDPLADAAKRSSGTGGFAFYGETALPVFDDLNSPEGCKAYGLDPDVMKDVKVVSLRVRDGDDASCLNLNRAQQPRLLGVRPEALAERKAFTFVKTTEAADKPWLLLNQSLGDGIVPAIGDDATVTWGLGKKVGDTLDYTDDRGQPLKVRIVGVIANSILQGSLLIAEDQFIRAFPSSEGYRAFLVDCPAPMRYMDEGQFFEMDADFSSLAADQGVRAELSRGLQDVGLELTLAARRLAEFNTVENTYLTIFQALGGLGLLLGTVGLGVVVLRNVLERRNELAILRAVGFRKRALVWLVLSEHWGLLALGLAVGTASAIVAVLPALRSPGADVPYLSLSLTLAAVAASGLLWTWLATLLALRGPLMNALRSE